MDVRSQLVLMMCVLFSPGFIMHIGVDVGRFDWVGLIMLLASIVLVEKNRYLAVSVVCTLGILSHEGFFMIFLPTVCAVVLFHNEGRSPKQLIKPLVKSFALPLIAIVMTFKYGLTNQTSAIEVTKELLTKNAAFRDAHLISEWWDDPFNVIVRSLGDNLKWVNHIYGVNGQYPEHRIWIFAGILWFIVYVIIFCYYLTINRVKLPWFSIAAISPIAMVVIALDSPRMISLGCITVFVLFLYMLDRAKRSKVIERIHIPLWPASFIILTGIFAGPFSDMWLFPTTLTPMGPMPLK